MKRTSERHLGRAVALVGALAVVAAIAAAWVIWGKGLELRRGRPSAPAILLDEAFCAARPRLTVELQAAAEPVFGRSRFKEIPIQSGTGAFFDAALYEGFSAAKGKKNEYALVASPLIAAALLQGWAGTMPSDATGALENRETGGFAALGGARIVVPEWYGPIRPGLLAVKSDARPAFKAAGRAMGSYIAALQASRPQLPKQAPFNPGGSEAGPCAGILFRERPSRERACLDAFIEAYRECAHSEPFVVELSSSAGPNDLEAAVNALLSIDLRVALVSVGAMDTSGTTESAPTEVLKQLERPGLALGVDASEADPQTQAAFSIRDDDAGLAGKAASLAQAPANAVHGVVLVPSRMDLGPEATKFMAGKKSLAAFLALAEAQRGSP